MEQGSGVVFRMTFGTSADNGSMSQRGDICAGDCARTQSVGECIPDLGRFGILTSSVGRQHRTLVALCARVRTGRKEDI